MQDIQYAFRRNERFVGTRVTAPDTSPAMALFKAAKPNAVEGRALLFYWGAQTRCRGGSGYVAENGNLPAGGKAATSQMNVACRLGVMTVEFSDHEIQLMKRSTSALNRKKVAKTLAEEVAVQRQRILCDFFTRDDSVKGRCAAAVSGATTVYSSIPIRFVVGDLVFSYPDPGSDEERLLTGTAIETESYVMNIETDATDNLAAATGGKIIMSTAVTYEDESVLTLPTGALATSVLGIESHFDTVNDASFQWDADDGDTVNHGQEEGGVPFYGGVDRSSLSMLNSGTINAGGDALSLNYLTRAAQKSIQQGGQKVEGKLVCMMHPLQYDRFLVTQEGKTPRDEKVRINGVDFTLPVITTGTARRLSVITTPMVKDGVVLIFPKNSLGKVFETIGWDEGGMRRQTASSGTGYAAKRIHYWSYWLNTYCDMPFYTTIVYGLDTSNT